MIFMPGGIDKLRFGKTVTYRYQLHIEKRLISICRDSDLIGISFMTHYYERAIQITKALKSALEIPIVWGGTHSTVAPEESLKYVNMVCIGEGEDPFLELISRLESGHGYLDTKSFYFKNNGKIIKNSLRLLRQDLDSLPPMDFDIQDHYVYNAWEDDVTEMDKNLLGQVLPRLRYFNDRTLITYRTMVSRGCPHNCTYCTSPVLKRMYGGQNYLRRRSVAHVMEELEDVIARYGFIESINFFDDTFFAAPISYLEEFSQSYKKRIGLPMYVQGSPTTITKNKIEVLIDAGCVFVEMGIQTGSKKTQILYDRKVPNEKVIASAKSINSHKEKLLTPDYHIILDNPWESSEDILQTLRLLLMLPTPFTLSISSLIFFPETTLAKKALEENLVDDDDPLAIGRKPFVYARGSYLNYLILLAGLSAIPRTLIRFLARPSMVKIFHREHLSQAYEFLYHLTRYIILFIKGYKALRRGDFNRIGRYFRKLKL